MYKLEYSFIKNTPIFKSNFCGNCSSFVESTSYATIKNRGCCWYFPKYTLMDIKNVIDSGSKEFIYELLNSKNSKVGQYYIISEGEFNEEKYSDYLKDMLDSNESLDFDSKLFFRLCPFATSKGCSIDFALRPHPCNLYLCREMLPMCGEAYKEYSEERKDYYSYMNYFSDTLRYALIDEEVNLLKNPLRAIEIIENTEIPKFLPRNLNPIYLNNNDDNTPNPIAG